MKVTTTVPTTKNKDKTKVKDKDKDKAGKSSNKKTSGFMGLPMKEDTGTKKKEEEQDQDQDQRAMFSSPSSDDSWGLDDILNKKRKSDQDQDQDADDNTGPDVVAPTQPRQSSSSAIKRRRLGNNPCQEVNNDDDEKKLNQVKRSRQGQGQLVRMRMTATKNPPKSKTKRYFFSKLNRSSKNDKQVTLTQMAKDKTESKAAFKDLVPTVTTDKSENSNVAPISKPAPPSLPNESKADKQKGGSGSKTGKRFNLRKGPKVSYTELDDAIDLEEEEERDWRESPLDSPSTVYSCNKCLADRKGEREEDGEAEHCFKHKATAKTYARKKSVSADGDAKKEKETKRQEEDETTSQANNTKVKQTEARKSLTKWKDLVFGTDDDEIDDDESEASREVLREPALGDSIRHEERIEEEEEEDHMLQSGAGDGLPEKKRMSKRTTTTEATPLAESTRCDEAASSKRGINVEKVIKEDVMLLQVETPKTRKHQTPPTVAAAATLNKNVSHDDDNDKENRSPPPRLMESSGGYRGLSAVINAIVEDELELLSKRIGKRIADAVAQQF